MLFDTTKWKCCHVFTLDLSTLVKCLRKLERWTTSTYKHQIQSHKIHLHHGIMYHQLVNKLARMVKETFSQIGINEKTRASYCGKCSFEANAPEKIIQDMWLGLKRAYARTFFSPQVVPGLTTLDLSDLHNFIIACFLLLIITNNTLHILEAIQMKVHFHELL